MRVVLVGGGLANCLIALRLIRSRPDIDLILLEQGAALGGRHTWSFFHHDVGPAILAWLHPLLARTWPGYEVRFPTRRRHLDSPYSSITSERLDGALRPLLGDRCLLGVSATRVEPRRVVLDDGRVLDADVVIDGRGPSTFTDLDLGFQKFVGQVVRLKSPHGLDRPILMDATVPQTDGYRFVYTLPFDDLVLLIEDTRYADGAALDRSDFIAGIRDYAAAQGWIIDRIELEEEGVLPVAMDGNIDAFWRRDWGVPRVGLSAALFHPTTGYSLPDAARLAERIAAAPVFSVEAIHAMVRDHSLEVWGNRGFFRLCNRMLFRAGSPSLRYKVFQRFYGLGDTLIRRFYSATLTWPDKARILTGKPPVPFWAAVGCIPELGPAFDGEARHERD